MLRVVATCALLSAASLGAQESVREIPAVPSSGFSFPYYLYVPKGLSPTGPVRLLVEPNNTGQASDDFEVHRTSAKRLASNSYARRIADRLQTPLLVPVFPRPRDQWRIYTHSLDRDSLLVKEGPLIRIDLQLIAMIEHARGVLKDAGIATKSKVFMNGFSASACFINRFAALHPQTVRALAAGALNALPMLPLETYHDVKLPFPLGVADLKSLTGAGFDTTAYREVSQYIYTGYLDRNDTFPFSDAWDDSERELIARLFGKEMMPARWERMQQIIATLQVPIQTVTYNGLAHATRPETWDDVVAFFQANEGDTPAKIVPHQFPFIPFQEIEEANVTKLYPKGSSDLPQRFAKLPESCTFVIAIKEWMTGQDHQQLRTFLDRAGFEFDLVAEGRESIPIDRKASCGMVSSGAGDFQGFYVCLDASLAARIAPGVLYSLRPKKAAKPYFWTVPPDAVLIR